VKKLKQSEIKPFREKMLKAQGGQDPITGLQITDAVLDHDHASGAIRCVLQREVNAFEGKVWNAYKRFIRPLGASHEDVMIALIEYWSKDYSENPTHPKHRTEKDKVIREYRKRVKRAKLQKTKDKYKALIKQLTNQS
tara:strand:- start:76 stop:489 length:414 start_codon:yes stop_codon:yes gene_type:complete